MDFELQRPDHLSDQSWEAIESYRLRLSRALVQDDRPAVLGGAKELIECIARVVMDARGVALGDRADMPQVVSEAQGALGRQPGRDVSMSPEVRVIAQSALTIAMKVNELRNQHGAGHGRAVVADIRPDEIETVAGGALLWCRWALRRLGHLLGRDVENLIEALRTPIRREELRRQFGAVLLPEQPPEDQRRLGVAFGQRAGGGFGNAWEVGLAGAMESEDLAAWPAPYRLGLIEGLVIGGLGQVSLTTFQAEQIVNILGPVPKYDAAPALIELADRVLSATWVTTRNHLGEPNDPKAVTQTLRDRTAQLPSELCPAFEVLVGSLEQIQ